MKKFDNDVASLQSRLSEMGDLAKTMVVLVTAAVKDRTRDVHAELYEYEATINKMQTDIDQEAIRMLTVYGPVAKDLRFLLVCTHVTAKLERIGDQSVNICQALELMTTDPADHPLLASVRKMADMTCEIVDDALDAYFSKNQEKAVVTRRRDDIIE